VNGPTLATGGDAPVAVRIAMPHHLRRLAQVTGEVVVQTAPPATVGAALTALEDAHPTLRGTIRDRTDGRRRPMIRIYADGEDLSDAPADTELPAAVMAGREPLRLVGAIAGG
jgi:sulfur-carrier protein